MLIRFPHPPKIRDTPLGGRSSLPNYNLRRYTPLQYTRQPTRRGAQKRQGTRYSMFRAESSGREHRDEIISSLDLAIRM